jgi:hypothetical protein
MNILMLLAANWDSVAVVVLFLAVVLVLIARKQYDILDKIIFALVTEAERLYGDGTGAVKLAAVIDWVYPKIPAVIRLFITAGQLTKMIEKVLMEAKTKWESKPNLSAYIEKPPNDGTKLV